MEYVRLLTIVVMHHGMCEVVKLYSIIVQVVFVIKCVVPLLNGLP